jgi:hypothetical protein
MKIRLYLIVIGSLLLGVGAGLHFQSRVLAQEGGVDPPYLAEFYDAWVGSPHAAADAEAFVHWDEEGEIPVECAKCHSTPGYRDFLGADGTDFRSVENPAPTGTVISCDACHNSVASFLDSVVFPSGVEVAGIGDEARCMECHQGRASTDSVNAFIEGAGMTGDPDTVSADLGFGAVNIHYYAAAASLFGSVARGGYQYEGNVYQMQNLHVPEYDTCIECHNPHTLELNIDACTTCHEDVESEEDLRFIRMNGTQVDYDGDGDMFEGIAEEIETLQELLYEAMQTYAVEVAGTAIVYDEVAYPYYFIDTNANGDVDEGEAAFPNAYNAFTARLLQAAYNYQVTIKDPGGFAHNPTYHIQLLYDSIESLNSQLSEPIEDLSFGARNDPGHFNTVAEAFRHWDEDGEVPGTCARCHTAEGLPVFIANGVNIAEPPSNSLACSTCHDDIGEFTVFAVEEVTFPSGAVLSFGEGEESNLCLVCHQGRESTVSVNRAISSAGVGDDEVSDTLRFRNIHYFAAGATLFGSDAQGAYQYESREYNGRNLHAEDAPTMCTGCHYEHEPSNRLNDCEDCHEVVEVQDDVLLIRAEAEGEEPIDYDGDGDVTEPIRDEIMALEATLYAAIQTYAAGTIGTPIVYDAGANPYWFIDTNGNGAPDPEELNGDNRYATWTPTLLRAAYNYQYIAKDPGVFAHNPDYALQILYDSIEAIGGDVSSYTRPPVEASTE